MTLRERITTYVECFAPDKRNTEWAVDKILKAVEEAMPEKKPTKLKFEMSLSECSENEGWNACLEAVRGKLK